MAKKIEQIAEETEAGNKSIMEQIEDSLFTKLSNGKVLEQEIIDFLKKLNEEGELTNKEKLMEVLQKGIIEGDHSTKDEDTQA